MTSLNSALSSLANSSLGHDLKAAVPTMIALSALGATPAASLAAGVAVTAGTTTFFSDLGKELAGIGGSVVDGLESGVGSVLSGVGTAVSTVAAPVVYGLGSLINVMA